MTAVDGVGVGLLAHGTTVVDGVDPLITSSGAGLIVLGVEERKIVA